MQEDPILKRAKEHEQLREEERLQAKVARAAQHQRSVETQRQQQISHIRALIPVVLDLLKRTGYPETKRLLPYRVIRPWYYAFSQKKERSLNKAIAGWLINLSKSTYTVETTLYGEISYHTECNLVLVYLLS